MVVMDIRKEECSLTNDTANEMILLNHIKRVIEILSQIEGITLNQQQILATNYLEDNAFETIEEMSNHKEKLTDDLELEERKFERLYMTTKSTLTDKGYVAKLQHEIARVLKLKDSVILLEQANMELVEKDIKEKIGVMELQTPPQVIVNKYKKFAKPSL